MAEDKKVELKDKPTITLSNYEIHKQMYAQTPKSTDLVLNTAFASIGSWASTHYKDKHFMLMCKELSYFTTFHLNDSNYEQFKQEVKSCLEVQGTVWDIQYNHENDAYECWVKKDDDEFYMFYLFDSQPLTIEIN